MKLKKFMKNQKISVPQMAEFLCFSERTIQRFLTGNISGPNLLRVANALGCEMKELLEEDEKTSEVKLGKFGAIKKSVFLEMLEIEFPNFNPILGLIAVETADIVSRFLHKFGKVQILEKLSNINHQSAHLNNPFDRPFGELDSNHEQFASYIKLFDFLFNNQYGYYRNDEVTSVYKKVNELMKNNAITEFFCVVMLYHTICYNTTFGQSIQNDSIKALTKEIYTLLCNMYCLTI